MRIGLIGCSATKLATAAPAADLYTGEFYRLCRAWIERRSELDAWAILSAKHGLVMPGDVLEPYDVSLTAMTSAQHRAWCERVHDQLLSRWGDSVIYMVLAGSEYRAALRNMPLVEDVIGAWTRARRASGMSTKQAAMGIGVLKRELKAGRAYG